MDMSKRNSTNSNETNISSSMYLSFNSSMSSVSAYKTLESSGFDLADKENFAENSSISDHLNSTLEVDATNKTDSPTKTVKRLSQNSCSNVPLLALPKNIMREYKAICSTPSKEDLLRSVDVFRGSEAERCLDLGVAFEGVDDDINKNDNVDNSIIKCSDDQNYIAEKTIENSLEVEQQIDRNINNSQKPLAQEVEKEIIISQTGEASAASISNDLDKLTNNDSIQLENTGTTSNIDESYKESTASKSIDTLSLALEQKLAMLSTTDEESVIERKQVCFQVEPEKDVTASEKSSKNAKPHLKVRRSIIPTLMRNFESTKRKVRKSLSAQKSEMAEPESENKLATVRKTRKSIMVAKQQCSGDKSPPETQEPIKKARKSSIPKAVATNPEAAKSSRTINTRRSLAFKMQDNEQNPEREIPKLLNKMKLLTTPQKKCLPKTLPIEENNEMAPTSSQTGENSNQTTAVPVISQGIKRPYGFTQRMSLVVKTTLNSPSRKMVRKSSIPANPIKSARPSMYPRKSVIPTALPKVKDDKSADQLDGTKNPRNPTRFRRNQNEPNVDNQIKMNDPPSLAKQASVAKTKIPPKPSKELPKPQSSFTCNICKSKFNLKSLLEAHKWSHEETYNLKPKSSNMSAASSTSSLSSVNQCKYCDKKFALVRTLHIHLLEKCTKIPPKDKRKLEYKEMDHVEKAQIPHFDFQSTQTGKSAAASKELVAVNENAEKKDNSIDKALVNSVAATPQNDKKPAPPNQQSCNKAFKKPSAHSGVYRTPSKTVPCHICKQSFKSILEYTKHAMTVHNSNDKLAQT